jgi:hypothetical protein
VSEYDREALQGEAMTRNWVEALQNKNCALKKAAVMCVELQIKVLNHLQGTHSFIQTWLSNQKQK